MATNCSFTRRFRDPKREPMRVIDLDLRGDKHPRDLSLLETRMFRQEINRESRSTIRKIQK